MLKKSFVFCLVLFCVSFATSWGQYHNPQPLQTNNLFVKYNPQPLQKDDFFVKYNNEILRYNEPFPESFYGIKIKDFKVYNEWELCYESPDIDITINPKNFLINNIKIKNSKFTVGRDVKIGDTFMKIFCKFGNPSTTHLRGKYIVSEYFNEKNEKEYQVSYYHYLFTFDSQSILKEILINPF